MPIGSENAVIKLDASNVSVVAAGSVRSSWVVVNDNATTAQTSTDIDDFENIDDDTFHWQPVPEGATRVWVRGRVTTAATTNTTEPVVAIIGLDANNVPMRIDAPTDHDTGGITIDFEGTITESAQYGSFYYSQLTNADGYDIRGCIKVGALVTTGAVITNGVSNQAVAIMFLFGN